MKILPLVRGAHSSVYNNIKTTKNEFINSQKEAKILAQRTEKIYKKNEYKKYLIAGRTRNVLKISTPKNLPIIGGLLGLALPFPLASVAFAAIGTIAGLGIYLHDKYRQKKTFR